MDSFATEEHFKQ